MKKAFLFSFALAALQGCAVTGAETANQGEALTDKQFADRVSATCAGYGKAARDNGGDFGEVFTDCRNRAVVYVEKYSSH